MTDFTTQRKRLLYLSWHRGTKESDLLLGPYAAENLPKMDEANLKVFAKLLDEYDADILNWVFARTAVPTEYQDFIAAIRDFKAKAYSA